MLLYEKATKILPKVKWHPRVLWVGIGCKRGTATELIENAIRETCQQYHLATEAIAGIASIDLKRDEVGILQVCHKLDLPWKTFSAKALQQVKVPNPSEVVTGEVGTPSVAEAAAMLAAEQDNLLVAKQIYKQEGIKGAVTIAIAQRSIN
ncbi:MAG: cobalamin biosynthesis protein [Pleurocapsa sp.]